ncbi:MAG TPA: DUF6036 family nucleotidyltransferase [Ignavibacteriaceae bacterium]|jgi:hypothetical protein|nr:DUF6036 family nucleotidyltransferase [Ignavibacteriaceae bacterium]
MNNTNFSGDILDFLNLLFIHKVKYLIVGGEAVIYYGHARLTGDIDIFYELNGKNIEYLYAALNEFWNGDIPGIESKEELIKVGLIFQFGVPPNRIDLLNTIEKVKFNEAWEHKVSNEIFYKNKTISIYYISLDDLIKNKEAVGRYKDQDDLKFLIAAKKKGV